MYYECAIVCMCVFLFVGVCFLWVHVREERKRLVLVLLLVVGCHEICTAAKFGIVALNQIDAVGVDDGVLWWSKALLKSARSKEKKISKVCLADFGKEREREKRDETYRCGIQDVQDLLNDWKAVALALLT